MDEPRAPERDTPWDNPSDGEDPPPPPDTLETSAVFFAYCSFRAESDSVSTKVAPRGGGDAIHNWTAIAPSPSADPDPAEEGSSCVLDQSLRNVLATQ